tara:strand:- start:77 stop:637 length:561 start_codon:yes stop_codon:yes gene_type:complete
MSNNESSNPDVKQDSTNVEGVNESTQVTKDASNDTIPRARLNEEIAKRKELDARLSEFEKAKEIEAQKKLEEKGNYKTILDSKDAEIKELKGFKERFVHMEKEQRDEALSQLSEEDRAEFNDLPTSQLKKVVKRLKINTNSNPVDDVKPTSREFKSQSHSDFSKNSKGMTSKQKQKAWLDWIKSNN